MAIKTHKLIKIKSPFSSSPPISTFVDMFSGIGGFHAATKNFGLQCVFACDLDKEARKAYEFNFGIKPSGDICSVYAKNFPDHDLLCAGFPCQPFSIIGKGAGFSDGRGALFFEIARILKAKKPKAVVLENVKQLSTHNSGKTIKKIVSTLEEMGYGVQWKVLNAINFGLPQKRERVIIVGLLNGMEEFLWPSNNFPMRPLKALLEKKPDDKHYVSQRIKERRHSMHKSPHDPGIWHENKAGNVSSHPFSCALRAGASYNYLLVNGERRLTPREMLRLQGFPESFEIVCNDSQTRKQAGNAVPVPMVSAVIQQIIKAASTKAERKQISA